MTQAVKEVGYRVLYSMNMDSCLHMNMDILYSRNIIVVYSKIQSWRE